MERRMAIELKDKLDWRNRLLNYGLHYMQTDIGRPNWERIADDLNMLVLEMRQIIEDNGIEEDEPGHEGPLGPLPPDITDALGEGPAEAI